MKKKLFPIAIGIFSAFFMVSCESDRPEFGGGTEPEPENAVSKWIFDDIMTPNYLWDLPTSPDKTLEPEAFFQSIKNKEDKISSIRDITKDTPYTYNDPGFDYAANDYAIDKKTYYVIYYVKKNTSADIKGLKRGYIIKSVNGTDVTKENSQTLLNEAAKSQMKLTVFHPTNSSRYFDFTIDPPASDYKEDPLYVATDTTMTDKKVGYILYNKFEAGGSNTTYDNAVASKLQEFADKGINYLVLDLRYNAGGILASANALASAIVKSRSTNNIFVINKWRPGLNKDTEYKFLDKTIGGTNIPKLGDNLKQVYILTGQYTAGTSEAFINSLKAYWGNDLILIGENTRGSSNIAVAPAEKDNTWALTVAVAQISDKDGKANYASGFTPNIRATEVNETYNLMLLPLGSTSETVYKAAINSIKNSTKSATIESDGMPSSIRMSSVGMKPWAGQTIVDLDGLDN